MFNELTDVLYEKSKLLRVTNVQQYFEQKKD